MTETGETTKSEATTEGSEPVIPKTCKAGVVINAGPNFTTAVEDVPVPEPGISLLSLSPKPPKLIDNRT